MCYFVAVRSEDGYDCVVLDPRGLTVSRFGLKGMFVTLSFPGKERIVECFLIVEHGSGL